MSEPVPVPVPGETAPHMLYQAEPCGPAVLVKFPEGADPFAILEHLFKTHPWPKGRGAQESKTPPPAAASQARPPLRASQADPSRGAGGVRDTSRAAYRALEWSGRLAEQQRAVVDFFLANEGRDFTRRELEKALGIDINAICGRVHELLTPPFEILVETAQKRRCSVTGSTVTALELARTSSNPRREP